MKPARIIPLLLLSLALFAPRTASATPIDTFYIHTDCGSSTPTWDFSFFNAHPQFITGTSEIPAILLVLSPDSKQEGFSFYDGAIFGEEAGIWDYNINNAPGASDDSLRFFPENGGIGILQYQKDSEFQVYMGGPGGIQFPPSLYDHPFTFTWYSIASGTVVNQGTITLIPTSFQGNCTFDSVGAFATTPVCDPIFDFRVFNHNGLISPISALKFETIGTQEGSIRASDIQLPQGWVLDTVKQFSVYVSTNSNPINYNSNMDGFRIALRANSAATNFAFVTSCYDQQGSLIDRDSTLNVPATPQACSENTNPDSVSILNANECNFVINVKNDHNGDIGDTVSPISTYTFTIMTPGVTWDPSSPVNPPQAANGTWQFSVSGNVLNFHLVPKYLTQLQYAQPGGTTWTPRASLDDPNSGEMVVVQWADSLGSTFLSSGFDTINCNTSLPDTSWVVAGSDCSYSLIVHNIHTNRSTSINAIAITIPVSAGSFPKTTSCFSSSNGWDGSVVPQSARFTNLNGASGLLATGSFDTIHFCIDPAQVNTPWTLSWTPIDSLNRNEVSTPYTINVAGCSPPLVCDSIRHSVDPASCTDTLIVLNQREGGATVDSIVVTPMDGATIGSTMFVSVPWQTSVGAGNSSLSIFGGSIPALASKGFIVSYNSSTTAPFHVQVSTYVNGLNVCSNTQTAACAVSAVTPPPSIAQSLAVSVVPNPMNQQAEITLTTGASDRVQMTLLDVMGRTSKMVTNGTFSAGDHDFTLDVSQLAAGTYYLRIEASGATLTKKLVIQH